MQCSRVCCCGYAESRTADIWGEWVLSPPQCGAYTLDIDAFVGLEPTSGAGAAAATVEALEPAAAQRQQQATQAQMG